MRPDPGRYRGAAIMKAAFLAAYTIFGLSWGSFGMVDTDPGAPELKGVLKCEIQPDTTSIVTGSRVWMNLRIESTASGDVELPCPGSSEPRMLMKVFLVSRQATGEIQRAIFSGMKIGDRGGYRDPTPKEQKALQEFMGSEGWSMKDERPYFPSVALPADATMEQKATMEKMTTDSWKSVLGTPPRWISIPPHGTAEFQVLVEMTPRSDVGDVAPLAPGACRIQCSIMYFPDLRGFTGALATNAPTSSFDIAKAKGSRLFLLDKHKLWTGKMESNVEKIDILERPK
jgi:hypothetical protein